MSAQPPPPDTAEPMDYIACTPPPLRHGDSSSSKTTTGSFYSPDKSLPLDEEIETLDETDPPLMEKYFLVKGRKLLELLKIARCGYECNSQERMARLTAVGSN
ncbi:unnamed protein product [Cylicocyclus nassatus]|uniref:Uncharacterized protein n=1 Tax=Cylicocyclus nassatus TaxID=53992 RepID=A0AA36GTL9_CYLNA|nr:unnamed protein product [Cylicocyclus nassatus]